jgi:hypothetical protein
MSNANQAPRAAIHESPVHFRAKASLVEAAKNLAEERGMSLAEFMRHALRREIEAAHMSQAERPSGKLTEKPTVIKRAAGGDINAQRQLLTAFLLAGHADPASWGAMLDEAEVWARMAAANGISQDYINLVIVLGLRASEARGRGDSSLSCQFEAEGISIVLILADEGDAAAAAMLPGLLERADTGVVENAKLLVATLARSAPLPA